MSSVGARQVSRAVLVALIVALLGTALPREARGAEAPTLGAPAAATSQDFATMAYGDPWDFANAEDVRILHDRTVGDSVRLEDGELRFNARGGASLVTFVFPGYGGALYMERDGGAVPIDAGVHTHLAMRIYSPSQRAMSFSYDRCLAPEGTANFCRESTDNVILEQGWNTVVRDLRTMTTGRPHTWSGQVHAFRMMNDVADGYRVEYVRLQTAPQSVTVTGTPGEALFWDRDDSQANNGATDPGWGRVATNNAGVGAFPAGAMEPGEYRFYSRAGATPSPYSQPLKVAGRPSPIVLDPDLAGGEDYATATGNPWDFAAPDDVIAIGGASNVSFGPQGIQGTNANNDPYFYLRVPTPIDANRYHRLTVHATYEGGFELADIAGGGTHGRLMWTRADRDQDQVILGNKLIQSRETVHYPGQPSFTVDLKTPPDPTFVMETDAPERDGWSTGSPVTHVRYDPNEDRGARRWRIARIELRATDETSGNAFTIRWRDALATEPVKVTLAYRAESGGPETQIATDVTQVAGVNSYRWDTSDVPPGRYVVRVTGNDGISTGTNLSTGPVDVRTSIRVAGASRIATGVALSQTAFPNGADAAVLARADAFPDALAAAALTAAAEGPLLLNGTSALDSAVEAELKRLDVRTVYVMGGESAQSSVVTSRLGALGYDVRRLSGPDRYATAAAAAEEAGEFWGATAGEEVIVALGTDFPDALAAGPLAGHARRPLLLTGKDSVPAPTLAMLEELGTSQVTVIGGTSAVSDAVVRQLQQGGRTVTRLAGASRHETAELAARAAVDAGAQDNVVFIASGRTFPDALGAGPAAQAMGGVLLLTERDVLPAPTKAWVSGRKPMRVLKVAGGAAAISDNVEAEIIASMR